MTRNVVPAKGKTTRTSGSAILFPRRTMRRRFRRASVSLVALLVLLREATPQNISSVIPTQECGTRPLMDEKATASRIKGGHDAEVGAWPWQFTVKSLNTATSKNQIKTQQANDRQRTSFQNPTFWRVMIGMHNLYKYSFHAVKRRVRTITIHSDYDSETFENDVALFKLIRYIKYNNYIQPICLPDILTMESYRCYITGWGKSVEEGRIKIILQEAQVDIIPLIVCNRHNWYGGTITNNMLCAGSASGHVDSCQGDSGGPLMCYFPSTAQYYLVGITSFGYGCGRPRHPGVYVRTVNYKSWINSHLPDKTTTCEDPHAEDGKEEDLCLFCLLGVSKLGCSLPSLETGGSLRQSSSIPLA
ncbi:transmembrane protease serine 12-like isoform X2 [Rhineura floridana]|uniref:transmembrane protease serine 12-like isoform X2 n=1 Tax=Rhineura floridana TaxID=261503 RepID=UPI002AC80039|nr:transmembrane protease serine 12-like isoform X2 [Rhineura floridana]